MALTQTKPAPTVPLTDAELMNLPRDGRKWEQVNGELQEVPTSFTHNEIIFLLSQLLGPFVCRHGGMTVGQAGFRMTGGNLRVPDLSFTRRERLPDKEARRGFLPFAPDLCVEIISPSENATDMTDKVNEYFASGAQQTWQIFPDTQTLIVFTSPTDAVTLQSGDMLTGGDLLPGFSCLVADLFAAD